MAYLSDKFLSIIHQTVERTLHNELKFTLHLFIDTIRLYVKRFDDALGEKWFLCDGQFKD